MSEILKENGYLTKENIGQLKHDHLNVVCIFCDQLLCSCNFIDHVDIYHHIKDIDEALDVIEVLNWWKMCSNEE